MNFVEMFCKKNGKRKKIWIFWFEENLPVPGGPYNKIPFHGFLLPENNCD